MMESVLNFFAQAWIFPAVLILTAAGNLAAAVFLLRVNGENVSRLEKIPRMKIPGILLGLADLLWCVPNAMPILPESLHKFLLPLVPVLLIAAWCVLDHLFARAAGGYLILAAHYFLKESYGEPELTGAVFAALCLIYGTVGIVISGMPYKARDVIRLGTRAKYRYLMPAFLTVFSIFAIREAILAWRLLS